MKKPAFAASIALAFSAWSVAAQTPTAASVAKYPVDASGRCIYPRDFSHVSAGYRAQVESFWNGTVSAHRISQQVIRDSTAAEMRSNQVDQRVGLSDDQTQLRERIGADGWAKQRQDGAVYQHEYDTFISSIPPADREAAARAVAVLVMPVDSNCPKGFQIDPLKLPRSE